MLIRRKRVKGICCLPLERPLKAQSRRLMKEREQRRYEAEKVERKLLKSKLKHAKETQIEANARKIARKEKRREDFAKKNPSKYWRQEASKLKKFIDDDNGFCNRLNALVDVFMEKFLKELSVEYLDYLRFETMKINYLNFFNLIKNYHEGKAENKEELEDYLKQKERRNFISSQVSRITKPLYKYKYWIIWGIISILLISKNLKGA